MPGWPSPKVVASRIGRFSDRTETRRNLYLLMVEFSSYEQGMENSSRPETGEFAAFLGEISDGALKFRNLDVLREEDL
jgi:hypothetical protein